MPKTTPTSVPKELLEQIYAEVESRVEAKFAKKIESLERKLEEAKEEAWHWKKLYFKERSQDLRDELRLARAEIKALKDVIEKQTVRIIGLEKQLRGKKNGGLSPTTCGTGTTSQTCSGCPVWQKGAWTKRATVARNGRASLSWKPTTPGIVP